MSEPTSGEHLHRALGAAVLLHTQFHEWERDGTGADIVDALAHRAISDRIKCRTALAVERADLAAASDAEPDDITGGDQ